MASEGIFQVACVKLSISLLYTRVWGLGTVSHCLVVGHASLLCHVVSSSSQDSPVLGMGPSSCLCMGRSYHAAQKMSLASDSAHHRCPPGASQHYFEKQMGRLIPGLFFDASYYLIADWQYPGQRDFTVQNGATVGGLSWSQQPCFLPSPCEAQGGPLLIYKCSVPLEPSWLQ